MARAHTQMGWIRGLALGKGYIPVNIARALRQRIARDPIPPQAKRWERRKGPGFHIDPLTPEVPYPKAHPSHALHATDYWRGDCLWFIQAGVAPRQYHFPGLITGTVIHFEPE